MFRGAAIHAIHAIRAIPPRAALTVPGSSGTTSRAMAMSVPLALSYAIFRTILGQEEEKRDMNAHIHTHPCNAAPRRFA